MLKIAQSILMLLNVKLNEIRQVNLSCQLIKSRVQSLAHLKSARQEKEFR